MATGRSTHDVKHQGLAGGDRARERREKSHLQPRPWHLLEKQELDSSSTHQRQQLRQLQHQGGSEAVQGGSNNENHFLRADRLFCLR